MNLSDIIDENNSGLYLWIEDNKKENDNLCQFLSEVIDENNASLVESCTNCD